MILVLSFLFKGESFSFVRGLWLLDMNNRKTFLWIFFGSPLHLVSQMVIGKSFASQHSGNCCKIYIFFGNLCLVYRRATSTWAFLQGFLSLLGLDAFCIRGFSLVSMRSMISSCYFSHDATNLIWLTFVVQERGRNGFLGQNVQHRTHSIFLKLIRIAGIITIEASTRFSR